MNQEPVTKLTLKDFIKLRDMENVYMLHDTHNVGFVPASYTKLLTENGREEHKALMNAEVKEIHVGEYGFEITLGGIDSAVLVNFDRAVAVYTDAEFEMGDITP